MLQGSRDALRSLRELRVSHRVCLLIIEHHRVRGLRMPLGVPCQNLIECRRCARGAEQRAKRRNRAGNRCDAWLNTAGARSGIDESYQIRNRLRRNQSRGGQMHAEAPLQPQYELNASEAVESQIAIKMTVKSHCVRISLRV